MRRGEFFIILSAFCLLAFQNCGTLPQTETSMVSRGEKGDACVQKFVTCTEGVQLNLQLAAPAPAKLQFRFNGQVILDECDAKVSTEGQLNRSSTDSNLLSLLVNRSILSMPEKFEIEVIDQRSCQKEGQKSLVKRNFLRDQFRAALVDSDLNCGHCAPPPTLTWDETSALASTAHE